MVDRIAVSLDPMGLADIHALAVRWTTVPVFSYAQSVHEMETRARQDFLRDILC